MINQAKLEFAKNQKFNFKIGDYLNDAFKIYGQHWQQFSLFALVSMLITIVSAITIIGPYLLMYPIQMGYGHVVDKIEKGESFEFNDFFIGFNKWTRFITFFIVMLILGLALFIPVFLMMGGIGAFVHHNEAAAPVLGLSFFIIFPLIFVVAIILSVVTFLVPYIIYHGNYGARESINISIAIVKKNFLYLLLFVLLFSIISQIGVYLCFVGVFASIPIGYIMAHLMVKDLLLNDGQNEIDTIGQSQEL